MKIIELSEQQLLKYFYIYPDSFDSDFDYFISNTGRNIFKGFKDLFKNNITPSKSDLLKYSLNYDESISLSTLDFIDSLDIHKDNFKSYLISLKDVYIRRSIENEELISFTGDIGRKSIDTKELLSSLEAIENKLRDISVNSDEERILTETDEIDVYQENLKKRLGGRHYPSGDRYIDEFLYNSSLMPEEVSIVFGPSGVGKSTFVDHLCEKRLLLGLPTLQITIEMSLESSLDGKMAKRLNIPRSVMALNHEEATENEMEYDRLKDKSDMLRRRANRNKHYLNINTYTLSLSSLEKHILKAKRFMRLKPEDYIFVSVDLLTQMKEFKGEFVGKANAYENTIDEVSKLAKKLKVHIMGVVQPKRPNEKVRIKDPDDVEKLRPNTEDLKNSGGLEERARLILVVFRRLHFINKYIPEDPALEYEDDVLDVTILKQNNGGNIGKRVHYLFNADVGRLYYFEKTKDVVPDDEE